MDEFERFLSKQPLRSVPSVWRREFLKNAPARQSLWREWLWPSPAAWATLAAVWLVIAGLKLAARPPRNETADRPSANSADIAVALIEQRRLMAEFIAPETAEQRSPAPPGPRSELTPGCSRELTC